jgi:hypothetical protein
LSIDDVRLIGTEKLAMMEATNRDRELITDLV